MRVVIAEDQYLLREGLVSLLESNHICVAAAVADSQSIEPTVLAERPDLVLLDIRLPPSFSDEGLRAAIRLRKLIRGLPTLLLSQHVEHLYVDELLADGGAGVGYLLKDRVFNDEQFITAMHTIQGGGTVIDPEVISQLVRRKQNRGVLNRLTRRELEVLELMAQGVSNRVIAERLVVTEKAVAKHINNLLSKLDLPPAPETSRRVQAVLTYLRS